MALSVTILTLLCATCSAYAVSRLRFRLARGFMLTTLASRMVPIIMLMVPLYVTLRNNKVKGSRYDGKSFIWLSLSKAARWGWRFAIMMLLAHAHNPHASLCQMLVLDLLGVAFARLVLINVEMSRVSTPIVRMITPDPKRLQQRLQLQKDFIFATAKDICQDLTCPMIDSMPEPPLFCLFAHKRPHFIDFGVIDATDDHFHVGPGCLTGDDARIRAQPLFFNSLMTV